MPHLTIHLVGFGSQGSSWAQCLRTSGWQVHIYLASKSTSFQKAKELGFSPHLIQDLPRAIQNPDEIHWIAMLCPDSIIPGIYDEFIARAESSVRLVLAHGFAIYSGELKLNNPNHQAVLFAPKAIGPKLLEHFNRAHPHSHSLVAAVSPQSTLESKDSEQLNQVGRGLGFSTTSLVEASFDQETIGDLISEQGLLCGGIFNLMELTMTSMAQAGIPDALIQEECLTELELIASMIRDRGVASTFQSISQAAQCGTITTRRKLEQVGFSKAFESQVQSILDKKFVDHYNSHQWQSSAQELTEKLRFWETKFKKDLS